MLIDRHRLTVLLALSSLAERSAEVRQAQKSTLEALLIALYQAATTEARQQFVAKVASVAVEHRPWAYIRRPTDPGLVTGVSAPPVLLLVLGQQDDEPDSREGGNRLPDRGATDGADWRALYEALDRWDDAVIRSYMSSAGWMLPTDRLGIPRDAQAVESQRLTTTWSPSA